MRLYLSGLAARKPYFVSGDGTFDSSLASRVNMLESFYYVKDWQTENLGSFKSFMLDSGIYTFCYGAGARVDFFEYTERYVDYIRRNDVKYFIEMDADAMIGYDMVRVLRRKLEDGVGRRCIPVWHINRGKEEWLRMCDEYDYVAIGDIANKGETNTEKYLRWFTSEAHKRGAKVHGLGYTRLESLRTCGLDSVDSTSWIYGNIGAFAYHWDGRNMTKFQRESGKRMVPSKISYHNFMQWVIAGESFEEG